MMRTGRILLVEREDELRLELTHRLLGAGHDVASVPDEKRASELLQEGLQPDIVVAESIDQACEGLLRRMAPGAVHLRIDREAEKTPDFARSAADVTSCSSDPAEVLRRVEEVLLRHDPLGDLDDGSRSIDLARRLANSLPHIDSPELRIDLVTEGFDAFFGVVGTLVVRQSSEANGWIEASRALSDAVRAAVSREIRRRTSHRSIRPFLTRLSIDGQPHEIACLSVQISGEETVLALELERAPTEPGLREALMNLVGSSVRAASTTEQLERIKEELESQNRSFDDLLRMSHEFARLGRREVLGRKILSVLRRELSMARSALFLPRPDGEGMLELLAASGFAGIRLDGIGLSTFHGVGRACSESSEIRQLMDLRQDGASVREQKMLAEAGLQWVASIRAGEHHLGLLFFGGKEDQSRLQSWEARVLCALLGSAAVALRNLEKIEGLKNLSYGSLNGLVAAAELRFPQDRGHAERVARGAAALGREVGLSDAELRELSLSALLHDVGKVGVLPGGNEEEAARLMRMHPILGSQILSRVKLSSDVVHGVEQHHERYDGHGYPYGYQGEGIHLFARVIAISDAFDRMLRGKELPLNDVLSRLELAAGLLLDPGLVATFSSEIGRNPEGSSILSRPGALAEILASD